MKQLKCDGQTWIFLPYSWEFLDYYVKPYSVYNPSNIFWDELAQKFIALHMCWKGSRMSGDLNSLEREILT